MTRPTRVLLAEAALFALVAAVAGAALPALDVVAVPPGEAALALLASGGAALPAASRGLRTLERAGV